MRPTKNQKKWARIAKGFAIPGGDRTEDEYEVCQEGLCFASKELNITLSAADLRWLFGGWVLPTYWFPAYWQEGWEREHDLLRSDCATLLSLWDAKELTEMLVD